jgi:DNA polymerase
MMTREDMLRELELLPVWQLRSPQIDLAEVLSDKPVEQIAVETPPASQLAELQPDAPQLHASTPAVEKVVTPAQAVFSFVASTCGSWIFVMKEYPQNKDELQLLNNIFKAISVQAKPTQTELYSTALIVKQQPKVVITLGELATQTLLQSNQDWLALRGQLHEIAGVKLVPTFDLSHLINNPLDKALAWRDYCLALQYLSTQI